MAKVLIADAIAQEGKDLLTAKFDVTDNPTITPEEILEEIANYDALIVRGRTKVTKAVIEAADGLKIVGRAGVGVDNIDLAAAQSKGIVVVNSPTATSDAVAELTMALMLSMVRHIPRADATMKAGQWDKKKLAGIELGNKTLGIIGFGRIGHATGELARAFGMRLIAYDPYLDAEAIQAKNAESVDLNSLFAQADVITMHMPLTPETKNFLNGEAFARMKRGVYLVCAARGGVIDETALLSSLESGQVAGAALDVFTKEPPGLTALVAHPNVVASPHIGAQTAEAQVRAAIHIAEEITAGLEGQDLRWKVV